MRYNRAHSQLIKQATPMLKTYQLPFGFYSLVELESTLIASCREAVNLYPNDNLRLHLSWKFWVFNDLASVYGIPLFEHFTDCRDYDIGFSRWGNATYPDPMQEYAQRTPLT